MNSEKKLKLIISSLNDKDLIKFFEQYIGYFSTSFSKSIRQISFNCYESVCQFRTKVVNGYGKNSSQAFINGVRNLIDLLLEDQKNQQIMKDCLKKLNESNQSKKKLLATEKTFKTNVDTNNKSDKTPLTMSSNFNFSKQGDKEKTIKQEIFQYLNLENLKISNPNPAHKVKTHQKYLNTSTIDPEEQQLKIVLNTIKEVQTQIAKINGQNQKLKGKLNSLYQREKQNKPIEIEKQPLKQTYQVIQPKNNNLMNFSSQNSQQQPSEKVIKQRSISVDPGQKYYAPQTTSAQQKKIKVPKLNLQILPNYHGKSNKSLNQSLLQVYQKSHK